MPARFASILLTAAILGGCSIDASGSASDEPMDGAGTDVSGSDSAGADSLFPTDETDPSDTSDSGATSADTATPVDTGTAVDSGGPPPGDSCVGDGGPCKSAKGCNDGVFACDGSCTALPDPAGTGDACKSPAGCNSGTIACDGSCSAADDPGGLGTACSVSGCSNGKVGCTGCELPAGAKTACGSLKCSVPVLADCFGVCPAKSPSSGTACKCCHCLVYKYEIKYDDCGGCGDCAFVCPGSAGAC
jgi:hypothetical protein